MTRQDSRINCMGNLDRIRIDDQILTIEGWVGSQGAGTATGLHATVSGKSCRIIDQVLQLPSPDVRAVFPALDDSDCCRFVLRVTLPEGLPSPMRDLPLAVEPSFAQGRGKRLWHMVAPSLPDTPPAPITFISSPSTASVTGSGSELAAPNRNAIDDMIPDYSVARYVGDAGAEQFKVVGRLMLDWFKTYCDLKPEESILEVGCGIGRIAIPLTQYLTTGRYEGFDIVRHGIEWCQQKVTPRYPNFNFFLADVYNKHYQPEGKQAAADYIFPFEDGTFDFVFLTSVFTHMMPRDVEHYTAEIGRVLKPGGRCFCTIYSISEEARRQLTSGSSRRAFKPFPEGYWSDTPNDPEAATAYPEEYLTGLFMQSGLETTQIIQGEWWKHEFTQDILISHKLQPNG